MIPRLSGFDTCASMARTDRMVVGRLGQRVKRSPAMATNPPGPDTSPLSAPAPWWTPTVWRSSAKTKLTEPSVSGLHGEHALWSFDQHAGQLLLCHAETTQLRDDFG